MTKIIKRIHTDSNDWSGLGFAAGLVAIIATSMLLPKLFSSHHPAANANKPIVLAASTTTSTVNPAPGPTAAAGQPTSTPTPTPAPAPEPLSRTETIVSGKYAGWTLYTSKKYGIAFSYPASWSAHETEDANPIDPESTQLTVTLSIATGDSTIALVSVTAHSASMDVLERIHDDILAQNPAQIGKDDRVNDYGRRVLTYTDVGPSTNTLYLISGGTKTYGVDRYTGLHYGDSGYDTLLNNFENLYESLVI